ncbi:MAG: alpha/beta hydrolase, partial [bacterium]
RDTAAIQREDYISFLRASTAYAAKPSLAVCRARVRIVAGGIEQGRILRSAERLHTLLPNSSLTLKEGMRHGEFSILHPADFAEELSNFIHEPAPTDFKK